MSSFGSSVINKSGKKLAPKAPVRRRPAVVAPSSIDSQDPSRAPSQASPPPTPTEAAQRPVQPSPPLPTQPSQQPSDQRSTAQDGVVEKTLPTPEPSQVSSDMQAPSEPDAAASHDAHTISAPALPGAPHIQIEDAGSAVTSDGTVITVVNENIRPPSPSREQTPVHVDSGAQRVVEAHAADASVKNLKRKRAEGSATAQLASTSEAPASASSDPVSLVQSTQPLPSLRKSTQAQTPRQNQKAPRTGLRSASTEEPAPTPADTSSTVVEQIDTERQLSVPAPLTSRQLPSRASSSSVRELRETTSPEAATTPATEETSDIAPAPNAARNPGVPYDTTPLFHASGKALPNRYTNSGQSRNKRKTPASNETEVVQDTQPEFGQATPSIRKTRVPRKSKARITAEDDGAAETDMPDAVAGADQEQPVTIPKPRPKKARKRRGVPVVETDRNSTSRNGSATPGAASRGAKRKRSQHRSEALALGENIMNLNDVDGVERAGEDDSVSGDLSKRKRGRGATPEGNENVTLVVSQVTMEELCSNKLKVGRMSRMEKEFRKIDWGEVERKRQADKGVAEQRAKEQIEALQRGERPDPIESTPEGAAIQAGIAQFHYDENGQLQVDTRTMEVNRDRLADEDLEALEVVEGDDYTIKPMNQRTYIEKRFRDPIERAVGRRKADRWGEEETERFYEALRMFGTDFGIIAKMFPGRIRQHIKAKFTREEKAYPEKIKSALIGEIKPMDFEEFKRQATGIDDSQYKDPRELERQLKEEEEVKMVEIETARNEFQEQERQRRIAEGSDAEGTAGEGGKKKRERKKKKKDSGKAEKGGEDIEILETIED